MFLTTNQLSPQRLRRDFCGKERCMSWALFSICQAKAFIRLWIFYIEQGFDRLAHGQRSRSEKGDWLTGSGRCVNKALGRHSRSLECLFRGIRDRATRSEVKCSSYTSWIIKVKNTDSSKEFQFRFSAGPGYVIRFSLAIGGAKDRMSPYLMYLLNRTNRGITATFWSCLIPRVLKRGEEATAAECTTPTPLSSLLFVSRGSI